MDWGRLTAASNGLGSGSMFDPGHFDKEKSAFIVS